jgi:hypothetical protein
MKWLRRNVKMPNNKLGQYLLILLTDVTHIGCVTL